MGTTIQRKAQPMKNREYLNKIHLSDTFEFVRGLPDNSVSLIVCDGPYGVSDKSWDQVGSIQEYNLKLLELFYPVLMPGGALYLFGKHDCIDFIDYRHLLTLKSRIIWYQPSRLGQGRTSYTNNYDIICYFVKAKKRESPLRFNLDDIRVPQLTDGAQQTRCKNVPSVKTGKWQAGYNTKGKNPGDVWTDIKQLTYKSKELANKDGLHTIQKPEALIRRIVLASSIEGDIVLDPFTGTGTCPVVCKELNRNYVAIDKDPEMVKIATQRLKNVAGVQMTLDL